MDRDDLRLADTACAARGERQHGEAHGDAVVLVGFKGGAVRTLAAADNHAVVGFLCVHACLFQFGDHGGDAVGFLYLELLRIADDRLALGVSRRDRDDRKLVDRSVYTGCTFAGSKTGTA